MPCGMSRAGHAKVLCVQLQHSCRSEDDNKNLCRYCVKYKNIAGRLGQENWRIVYVCGGCAEDDWLEAAYQAWRVCSKTQIFAGRVLLTVANLARKMLEFKARHLRTLKLHPVQLLRLMLLSGYYALGPDMTLSGVVEQR
jgi:hypothetical protein